MSRPPDQDPEPASPILGGRYQVVRELGRGSFARTLLCRDLQEDRDVAVKELRYERLEEWKHLDLFEREARALAMLDHPAIPKVVQYFDGDGSAPAVYLVQEFIDGPSLLDRMTRGPMLGQSEIHTIATEMLDVLDYLHGRAPPVLHRDIKPSNILLGPDGRVTLIDFGGVRLGWRPPEPEGATVVGTFGYMPPEQLHGQAGPESDLYALGATLLHLVSGRPPTDFPFHSGRIEVPEHLGMDRRLETLIEALLRPAPRDRPQSARAARGLLERASAIVPAEGPTDRTITVGPTGDLPTYVTPQEDYAPRFVDMGAPPRDPEGEFRDVYRNLIHPLYPARRLWSRPVHLLHVGFTGLVSVFTVGLMPLGYWAHAHGRKRQYDDLFRNGVFTRGVLSSSERSSPYTRFRYEFETRDARYVSSMSYASELRNFWSKGDPIPVLYDPEDPRRSCFVYR